MTPRELLDAFDVLAEAPNGIARLREMVLQVAMSGRLVRQDPNDATVDDVVRSLETRYVDVAAQLRTRKAKPLPALVETDFPHEIPPTWRWMRLQDVGVIVGGGTPASGDSTNFTTEGGHPWITPADMREYTQGKWIARGGRNLTDRGLQTSSAQLMPRGSVVFSSRAPIGYVALAANPLATNQGFKSVVPFVNEMGEFLRIYLLSAAGRIASLASGTTFKEVSGAFVAAYPVPVAPLTEQARIVARVDELMALIDRFEQARLRRESARVAFRDATLAAFRDSETNEDSAASWRFVVGNFDDVFAASTDCEAIHTSTLHLALRGRLTGRTKVARVVTTEPYDDYRWSIPSDWRWVSLADVAGRIVDGAHHTPTYVSQGVPFISAKNIDGGRVSFEGCRQIPREEYEALAKRCRPTVGDVLVTKSGSIGRVAVVTDDIEFTLFESVALVPVKPEVDPRYLALVIEAQVAGRFGAAQTKGAAVKHLHLKDLRTLPVPLPPLDTQRVIVQRLEELTHLTHAVATRLNASLVIAEATGAAFSSHSPQG